MTLYRETDFARAYDETDVKEEHKYRSPWRRDYARLIHSPSFRRLQGKTQVFPGNESDFYRNRLTHSLEVAQIAKSIAFQINGTEAFFKQESLQINPDIVEFAGLAHDLGHPPFGHNGEEALDECMRTHDGGFEGNAQSLRILAKLEKKFKSKTDLIDTAGIDYRRGLNLTYRSLAALLKYDAEIPIRDSDRKEQGSVSKGYYKSEAGLVRDIKKNVLGVEDFKGTFKTIECSIMDIADDIAYSTYDVEDNLKAGFFTPMRLLALDDDIYEDVAKTIRSRAKKQYDKSNDEIAGIDPSFVRRTLFGIFEELIFENSEEEVLPDNIENNASNRAIISAETQAYSRRLAEDGYERTAFTSGLIEHFLNGIEVIINEDFPPLSQARLEFSTFLQVEVLKNVTYFGVIRSANMQTVEYRGKDIVKKIFEALQSKEAMRLLPKDFRTLCENAPEQERLRTICDFIAGMTDRYAFEFFSRLYGTSHLTIHKPI